jgi:chemotaxis protein CheZ
MTFSTQIDKNLVKALLGALESDDQYQAVALLDELTKTRESELYQQVNALTQNLHQTLDSLNDNSLLLQTKHDIPDAAERLEYVVRTTEEASNKTLGFAEQAMVLIENLEGKVVQHLAGSEREALLSIVALINSELTNIMLAQSFQDLTGQVLNRVILIISSLEQSLIGLIDQSSHDYASIPARHESDATNKSAEMKGIGPNVTHKSKQDSAESQDDVDDLLADLGI